ncbi:MAG TPA: UDP-3-O-[3-hydroxymyristoyl] N-acetylglucosamine deacetylase [Candidatus Aminicenantes bacterium]|nr:UDP-3-O-[3-hydroxymyristoyl] N-acetylglucosamine deacetylase [Candidatus Aminicenantes bacterium]
MLQKQTTQRPVSFSGTGIHSGEQASLIIKPSSEGRVFFRRMDLGGLEVQVDARKIDALNCSCLVFESGRIQTLEHLLAVLYVLGLDSVELELQGEEIPILDGSAAPLAESILQAGLRPVPRRAKAVRILQSHTIEEKGASLSFFPDPDFRVSYAIDFSHPLIGRQEMSVSLTRKLFLEEIAPARTFGFLKDAAELRKRGLALGGSLDNAVVLDEKKVISGSLRFQDEFVRHKVLDLIGDLALFGHPLFGHFRAERAGHRLHHQAVLFLLDHPDFWAYEEEASPRFLQE